MGWIGSELGVAIQYAMVVKSEVVGCRAETRGRTTSVWAAETLCAQGHFSAGPSQHWSSVQCAAVCRTRRSAVALIAERFSAPAPSRLSNSFTTPSLHATGAAASNTRDATRRQWAARDSASPVSRSIHLAQRVVAACHGPLDQRATNCSSMAGWLLLPQTISGLRLPHWQGPDPCETSQCGRPPAWPGQGPPDPVNHHNSISHVSMVCMQYK